MEWNINKCNREWNWIAKLFCGKVSWLQSGGLDIWEVRSWMESLIVKYMGDNKMFILGEEGINVTRIVEESMS